MVSSFRQFIVEQTSTVYFTFGRMNPPTVGHEKLLDALKKHAGRDPYKVFVSQSQDSKKNPLSYSDKVKHIRKMFPKHARQVMINKKVKTVFDALVELYNQGYTNVVMVVGSDRVREFDILINKYNGKRERHGLYNFKTIQVKSAGARDPDADDVSGMSASKQRQNAANDDFAAFSQGVSASLSNADTRKLFNDVRKGMGLKEQKQFKNHIELEPVSETREQYIQGKLFEMGDYVSIKHTNEKGTITWLGPNYVVVKLSEDKSVRKWLDDVEKVEETAQAGTAGWDPGLAAAAASGPKPRANIKKAKKKLKAEANDPVQAARDRISREKKADARKYDAMLDRAKLRRQRAKNRASTHSNITGTNL